MPAILAEALDIIADRDHDLPAAAAVLGCTPSQLVKLLKLEGRAFARVNRERAASGAPGPALMGALRRFRPGFGPSRPT